jgi:formylglycine-generating enzyme required for sulfatase activity
MAAKWLSKWLAVPHQEREHRENAKPIGKSRFSSIIMCKTHPLAGLFVTRATWLLVVVLTILVTTFRSVLAQPVLGILPTNNQVILFWPSTSGGTNGVLQSTTNLGPPDWVSITDAVPVSYGSQTAVSVTNSRTAMFFRLSLVPPTADGMALIPAGWFIMGNSVGDTDRPVSYLPVPVTVDVSAFYMDRTLVTSNQWWPVYNWATNHGYGFIGTQGLGKAPNYPISGVDWYSAVKWCNARSEMAGLTPCYYTNAGQTNVYRSADLTLSNSYVNWSANGYRLPTEAEWEKAARGGLIGQRFPWGDTISESQANYYADTNGQYYSWDLGPYGGYNTNFDTGTAYTSPVGYFAANGYGLYDMAGNVFEWCWDWYVAPPYPSGSPYLGGTDPRGPASGTGIRVVRGGYYYFAYAHDERCAARYYGDVGIGSEWMGFRCVRRF